MFFFINCATQNKVKTEQLYQNIASLNVNNFKALNIEVIKTLFNNHRQEFDEAYDKNNQPIFQIKYPKKQEDIECIKWDNIEQRTKIVTKSQIFTKSFIDFLDALRTNETTQTNNNMDSITGVDIDLTKNTIIIEKIIIGGGYDKITLSETETKTSVPFTEQHEQHKKLDILKWQILKEFNLLFRIDPSTTKNLSKIEEKQKNNNQYIKQLSEMTEQFAKDVYELNTTNQTPTNKQNQQSKQVPNILGIIIIPVGALGIYFLYITFIEQ